VLATETKSHGFKRGRGDGFLKEIKIRSTPSFGWKVNPEAHSRKILRHVKDPLSIKNADIQNSHSFYSLTDVSAGRIARELWWTSKAFSPAGIIITTVLHAHMSAGG
jgi:hypothetical protein